MAAPERIVSAGEPRFDGSAVSVALTLDGRSHEISLAADGLRSAGADFLVPATLLPAMAVGGLRLATPVSPALLSAIPRVQEVYSARDEAFARVPVQVPVPRPDAQPRGGEVACFFSGGVDSFFTLLRHREQVTHLLLVHGFDIPLNGASELRAEAVATAGSVAASTGKTLVEVETDIRR